MPPKDCKGECGDKDEGNQTALPFVSPPDNLTSAPRTEGAQSSADFQAGDLLGRMALELAICNRRIATLEAQVNVLKGIRESCLVESAAAYGGDAVADASLLAPGGMDEESLMLELYGLTSSDVILLSRAGDHDSISVLNARATLRAGGRKGIPQDIEEAWRGYVNQLRQGRGQKPKEDPLSPLSQAYYRFWDVYFKCRR